jgi:hypothetical protein
VTQFRTSAITSANVETRSSAGARNAFLDFILGKDTTTNKKGVKIGSDDVRACVLNPEKAGRWPSEEKVRPEGFEDGFDPIKQGFLAI